MRPDRIVIGVDGDAAGQRALQTMRSLYAPFNRHHERTFVMDVRSAEFTKYAANAMLATRISFMNELANLADRVGADIESVRQGIGSDPRIGYDFLYAGTGYGGSCFPKDVQALRRTADENGCALRVLAAVEAVNDNQKRILVDKIVARFGADLAGRTFAIWGLAFKPNTDDMREAPSRTVIAELLRRGAAVARLRSGGHGRGTPLPRERPGRPTRRAGAAGVAGVAGRGARGRGCARHRHRVEVVPQPRSGGPEGGTEGTRGLRRPQPVRAGGDAGGLARVLRGRPLRAGAGAGAMKKVLVTGGAGFLGSHLCERLLSDGHDVLCVDNYFTGSKANIAHLIGQPRFEAMRHDVTFPLYVEVDEIYNLACPASPVHYQHDPVQTTKTSVHGAINMLGLAKRLGARILQASTSEVYGDPEVHPQTEAYWGKVNPIGVRSCYDEGKRCAETLFFDYWRQHDLRIKVVRIFNTYGPRMHPNDGRVVSNFIVQALQDRDITIYGDGSQTRSFCYVDDMVEAIVRMMSTDDAFTGPVNVGNATEFTILELAQKVIETAGSASRLVFKPLPSDDPRQRQPDASLAREKLGGWEARIQLDEGLGRTIDYFRSLLQSEGRVRC